MYFPRFKTLIPIKRVKLVGMRHLTLVCLICNMIVYFTLVYQYSTYTFIVNANLVSLLITGLNKKVIKKG